MAITAFTGWSATAASNVDLNSIPLSDSMLANQIDDAFREMMAQLAGAGFLTGTLGTGVATFLATPSSANLKTAVTDETGSGALVFATSPTLVTPTLGVASATSISFGNEALSAYDEGTWTPAMTFGGSATGITYSTQTGIYVKIGKLVWIYGDIVLSNNGSGSGQAEVTGLPVTASANTGQVIPFSSWANTSGVVGNLVGSVLSSTTRFQIFMSGGTIIASATDTTLTNTANITFSGCYMAAS